MSEKTVRCLLSCKNCDSFKKLNVKNLGDYIPYVCTVLHYVQCLMTQLLLVLATFIIEEKNMY